MPVSARRLVNLHAAGPLLLVAIEDITETSYDTVLRRKGDRRIDVTATTSPITSAAGRIVGFSLCGCE
jgi:hypothetical protein